MIPRYLPMMSLYGWVRVRTTKHKHIIAIKRENTLTNILKVIASYDPYKMNNRTHLITLINVINTYASYRCVGSLNIIR